RHVMRVRRRQRELWIARAWFESAALVTLEVQHFRREHPPALERPRDFLRHRAQIFADDDRAIAHALERDDAEQVVGRISHVCSVLSGLAFGYPEQTKESHHVIDAERARMPESAAY